ncbi:MAG: hypothetical protein ACN4GM_01805 [Gammaproteobacteria bacterium]
MGDAEIEAPFEKFTELYNELSNADREHTDVSLTHESEWCLAALQSGKLIWENVAGEGEPKHMTNVPKEKTLELWEKLAQGKLLDIESENWQIGYN